MVKTLSQEIGSSWSSLRFKLVSFTLAKGSQRPNRRDAVKASEGRSYKTTFSLKVLLLWRPLAVGKLNVVGISLGLEDKFKSWFCHFQLNNVEEDSHFWTLDYPLEKLGIKTKDSDSLIDGSKVMLCIPTHSNIRNLKQMNRYLLCSIECYNCCCWNTKQNKKPTKNSQKYSGLLMKGSQSKEAEFKKSSKK